MNILRRITQQLPVILIVTILASCGKEKKSVINVELTNAKPGIAYLAEFNLVSTKLVDSTEIDSDGSFKFKVKTTEPKFYQIFIGANNFILLLVEPGGNINVSGDAANLSNSYNVEGSEGSVQVKALTIQLHKTKLILDSLVAEAQKVNPKTDTAIINNLNKQYIKTFNAQRRFSIKFIIEHLNSMASIVALYQQIEDGSYVLNQNKDLQYVKLVSDSLKKYYPESKIVNTLWADRTRLLSELNQLKINSLTNKAKEQLYPNLNLPNVKGDTIELKDVKSKLILLNFWNPSNSDCGLVLGNLKEIYKKYNKKGFEIYNVALMTDIKSWIEITVQNDLAGINVIDPGGISSYTARVYNVTEFPANYLLDPKKGLVDKNIFGENLVTKIEETIK